MKKRFFFLLTLMFGMTSGLWAQAAPDNGEALSLDPRVRYGVLDNGLRYYIRQNAKPENRVMLQLAVNAGSICETEAQRGLAHFTEHMLFNGTKNFPKNELVNFLQKTGVRFGGDINAFTSFDETVYMLEIPTDKEGMLENGFQVLEDWAHQASMETDAIDDERGVIIEEWRMGLGADDRIRKKVLPVIFGNSLYAERLPIGTVENLKTFKPDQIRAFYRDFYRPDLQAVVVVGNIDPDKAESMVKKHFASIKNPAHPKERVNVTIPDNDEPIFTVATDPEAVSSSIEIYIKFPHRKLSTVGDYRDMLIDNLVSHMMGMRFQELAQSPQCPMVMAQMGSGAIVRNTDILAATVVSKPNMMEASFALLLQELARVDRYGFVQTELDRAKEGLMAGMENLKNEEANALSNDLATEYVNHFLRGQAAPGIAAEYALTQALLPGITLEEVSAYIQNKITDRNMVVIASGPEKDGVEVPSEDVLKAIYEQMKEVEVEPYEDKVSTEPLLELPLREADGIRVETLNPDQGVVRVTLSNGIPVTLKSTDYKADEILMFAYADGGTSTVEDDEYVNAMFASVIQDKSGMGQFDHTALSKRLTGKNLSYNVVIGDLTTEISANSSVKDFETLLQLNYLNFTAPRKDGRAAESVISRLRSQIRFLGNSPMYFFMDTLSKLASNHDPRTIVIPTAEQLASIDSNKVYDFYCRQIADPGAFRYYMVGNFDVNAKEFLSMLETYIGSLPAKGTRPEWKDRSMPFRTRTEDIKVEKGSDEQGMVGIVFTAPLDWKNVEDRDALRYFKEVMEIKMLETIREEMGGVYSPMLQIELSPYPEGSVTFMVMFGCDPERADDLTAAVMVEMKRIMDQGPLEVDMEKVRELSKRNFESQSKQNAFWLRAMKNVDYCGGDLNRLTPEAQAKIAAGMTAKKVRKAARKYFGKMVYVRVVLGPDPAEMEEEWDD